MLLWKETFPNEQLFALDKVAPWYTDIVNFLVTKVLPKDLARALKERIKSDAKYFVWDDP